MRITVLGSGTSTGVPEYRCECEICTDARRIGSKNRRTRASIWVENGGHHIQFDVGPNFSDQIDNHRIPWIDAVFFTHCHSDHIGGVNDLVMPCRRQNADMPIYGPPETIRIIQRNNDYMFDKNVFRGGGVGHLIPHSLEDGLVWNGFDIVPIPVEHGVVSTSGYRLNDVAYIPDAKRIPQQSRERLRGLRVLILDAMSFNPRHPTHLSVGEAVDIVNEVQPEWAFFTHISHGLDQRFFREQCEKRDIILPPNAGLAYDGQLIEV